MSFPADWVETLVAESSEASASIQLPKAFVDSVYFDLKPMYSSAVGGDVRINVMNVNSDNVTDIANGPLVSSVPAISESSVTVAITKKASNPRSIPDFDELKSNYRIAQEVIAPLIEETLIYVNKDLASFANSTSLTASGTITGGADTFTRANFAAARSALRKKGVDFSSGEVTLFLNPDVYGNVLASDDFKNESAVGITAAEAANQLGALMKIFGAYVKEDNDLPVVSTSLYGAAMIHKNCIAVRAVVRKPRNDGNIVSTVIQPKPGLFMNVETWYDPNKQSNMIHVSCTYGRAVIRPEFGVYLQTT
jgi:hypothetical protein